MCSGRNAGSGETGGKALLQIDVSGIERQMCGGGGCVLQSEGAGGRGRKRGGEDEGGGEGRLRRREVKE